MSATANSTWGQKETIVWPPHAPIYGCTAVAVAILATLGFAWQHFAFSQSLLQRSYTATYIRSLAEGMFMPRGSYRLIYVGGGKKAPRPALPADFEEGETVMPDGARAPIVLSSAAKHDGFTFFYRAPEHSYANAPLSTWLRTVFFNGEGMLQNYTLSLAEGVGFLAIALPFAVGADVRRYKELKYGRRLKGPIMLTPRQFNKTLDGAGLGIRTDSKGTILRLPRAAEPKHIQIMGDTGAGKTTVLASIREGAEKQGYTVEGFAPSSRAAGQLRDAAIRATTLQSFIARGGGKDGDGATPNLYMLDESSLASTKQMRAFLDKIGPNDRVLVIGDTRQHQAVDAGRPFQQMQEAGMQTSQPSEIVRQKDPALLKAVELLAKGETAAGVKLLADQGRITEIANGTDRIAAIARTMQPNRRTRSSSRPTTAAGWPSTRPCGPSCRRMALSRPTAGSSPPSPTAPI